MTPALARPALWAALAAAAVTAPAAPPPGATPVAAPTWRFEPAPDAFSPDALLDLRPLNETVAGETGFVRVGADGGFVRGDGRPLRFWAVNTEVGRGAFVAKPLGPATPPDLARHARFLAKRGVNMVRLHRQLSPHLDTHPDASITDIDEAERDGIWRTVAAMRKEGIYTTISPYWAGPMRFAKAWGIAGGTEQSAYGLLFFDPTLQAAYRSWLKKLLTEPNPYTGVALAQDTSVALIQLQNEDSLLFWTAANLQGAQREALEALYGRFLATKYGSLANALSAWRGESAATDAPASGRLALLPLWELTQPATGARSVRLADQTEFVARTMHEFNRRTVDYLRHELGVRQLVNAGNWRTASNERLGDAERWSYTAGDVDAANVYTGGIHLGPYNGWAVAKGDRFTVESVLRRPQALPISLKQTAGRPMLVTEGGWVMPNGFGAEGPFLIAAYASLTGVGGYYWFTTGDEGWAPPQSGNGYLPSQQKWSFADPDVLGTFPAAALAYRSGYLRRGAPVVAETRSLQDLWQRRPPALVEATSFDPNRDAIGFLARLGWTTPVPAAAFLVGPATVAFGAESAAASVASFSGLVEPGLIRANTGQIVLNAAQGFCTVDAPMVQGVAAHFAQAPMHALSDVRFTSGNAFGAALAVSMDGAPLRRSRRVLVQYGTQSRPTGWVQAPAQVAVPGRPPVDGFEVVSHGRAPWQVEQAMLDVVVKNPGLTRATALDMNGMATGPVALTRDASQVAFRFPSAAMYVVLR
jgi:hypothetical protein